MLGKREIRKIRQASKSSFPKTPGLVKEVPYKQPVSPGYLAELTAKLSHCHFRVVVIVKSGS